MYFAGYQIVKEGRLMSGRYLVLLMLIFIPFFGSSQNYQAVHGSSYAGSLGVTNNPASIVHVPYSRPNIAAMRLLSIIYLYYRHQLIPGLTRFREAINTS